jgi:hypothetical protein
MEKTMEALSNVWGLNHKTGNSWRKKVGEGPDWMAIRNQLLDDIYEPWSIDQKATWIEEMLENIKMTMDDEVRSHPTGCVLTTTGRRQEGPAG